ncbi:MAG: hydantoinase B/oxoprolinase family protein, partial [Actinomycetota bacterium]|nr:hydantoinase B/oxoprolinase family protein [Actinomycetota bacterium]
MYDRTKCAAQGICGGSPGATGTVRTAGGGELHPKRQQRLAAGERVTLSLPGGGGYGDPLEREPRMVARDVEDGLVSVERAREVYGVVLARDERAGPYTVEAEATASQRGEPK